MCYFVNNLAEDCSILLKFCVVFKHVHILQKFRVKGSKVKVSAWRNVSENLLNFNKSATDCSILLTFDTECDQVISDLLQTFKIKGSKVKVTASLNASKKITKSSIIQPCIAQLRCKLVLFTNRKSYMGFGLVPKSITWMTLNGVMALILRYFAEFGSFRGPLRKSGWLAKSHQQILSREMSLSPLCGKTCTVYVRRQTLENDVRSPIYC